MKAFSTNFPTRLNHWCCLVIFALFAVNTALAQPANDDCADAIALVCGDIVSGDNTGADTEELPACGMVFPGQTVWYSIVGTGGDITASTCSPNTDFDTQLGVYSGSCGALTCVAGNNNDLGCENPRFSTVTWASEAGVTYYIVVAGVLGADGAYELSIDCAEVGPENDACADAEPVSCGDVVSGSTTLASDEPGISFCGTTLTGTPGVWYVLSGDGSSVTASLCNTADYDTKIGIFSGSCGSLVCVAGNDDGTGCSGFTSEVNFPSVAGEDYYIFVSGFNGSTGDFDLSITCEAAAANDDVCDAIALTLGVSEDFNTEGASVEGGEPNPGAGTGASSCDSQDGWCSFELDVDASLWYTFVAPESGCVNVELTGGDSQLAIWSVGDCGDFGTYVEVAANDDGGVDFAGALFNLLLEPGETYYVQVDDYGGGPTFADGTITVSESADCDFPQSPATCDEAVAIGCGDFISGNTTLGAVNNLSCGPGAQNNLGTAPGLWYIFEGNDSEVTLNTCSPILDFDIKLGVFSGSCDALTCLGVSGNLGSGNCPFLSGRADELSFLAFAGTTYYVYVTGNVGAAGLFDMTVDCAPINDECAGALTVGCGDTVSGSTLEASPDAFPACGSVDNGAPGVWYTITAPADGMLTASTCNQAGYDTKLFIFEGACGALSCIAGNDDGPGCSGFTSEVSWATTEGLTYYILVTGFNASSTGDFDLTVSGDCGGGGGGGGDDCDDAPDGIIDDACDADCLELGVGMAFSNAGATVQAGEVDPGAGASCDATDGWCSFEPQPFLDGTVWFKFIAPASGCVDVGAIDADLQIAVWSVGDCSDFGTFVEIGANDDGGPGVSPFLDDLAVNPGETYYVQIDGYNGTIETDGTVTVSDCSAPIAACDAADEIFCGDVITDSTNGIAPLTLSFCGTDLSTAGGAWYKFTGLGDNVTISTCGASTNYDTKLGIFTGDCTGSGLTCVGGNDDACGLQSEVTFAALNGVEYFIYVTGFLANTGTYELAVTCVAPLAGDENGLSEINTTQLNPTEASDNLAIGDFYPNPTDHNTNVQIFAPVEAEAQIQLFDAVGRLAHRSEVDLYSGVNTVELQVANLPVGSYFAKIIIGKETFQKKLVIVK